MKLELKSTTPPALKDRWRTSPDIFEKVSQILRVNFDLDAAASPENALVDRYICDPDRVPDGWTGAVDTLSTQWDARCAWINPPFSRKDRFMKVAHQQSIERGVIVAGPLPYTPDTRFWQWLELHADTIFMPDRRIQYLPAAGGSGGLGGGCSFYSAIVLWTPWAMSAGGARHCRIKM